MYRGNAPLLARKKTDCRSLTRDFSEEFCGFLASVSGAELAVTVWSHRARHHPVLLLNLLADFRTAQSQIYKYRIIGARMRGICLCELTGLDRQVSDFVHA